MTEQKEISPKDIAILDALMGLVVMSGHDYPKDINPLTPAVEVGGNCQLSFHQGLPQMLFTPNGHYKIPTEGMDGERFWALLSEAFDIKIIREICKPTEPNSLTGPIISLHTKGSSQN